MTAQTPVEVVTCGPDAEEDPRAENRLGQRSRRWWPGWVCFALYMVLTILEFGPTNSLGSGTLTEGQSPDQIQQVQFLEWVPYALAHGHNPFFTQWQNYPVGFNTLVDPSMVALGTFFSPITYLFGPIVTWNVLLRLAFILSAMSMCLVMRRWTSWWPATFVGGLFYGFSMYMIADSAHLFLVFVPLPPFILLLCHEIVVRQRWRPRRTGALLGLLCGLQYLISSEILLSTVVIAACAIALYVIARRKTIVSKWPYAKTAVISATAVGAVLLVYPVYFTLFGPGHINGVPNPPGSLAALHADLLGPFLPNGYPWLTSTHFQTVAIERLTSSAPMYLGIPFAAVLVAIVVWLRRRPIVRLMGAMLAVAFILSLGSRLYIYDNDTKIPLPFIILAHLPFFDGLLAVRLSLFTALFGAGVLTVGLDEGSRRLNDANVLGKLSPIWRKLTASCIPLAVVAVIAIPILPGASQPATASDVPPFFTSASLSSIPSGSVVLTYPYPNAMGEYEGFGGFAHPFVNAIDAALLAQSVSGMRFKLIGGYGWRPRPDNMAYGTPAASPLEPASVEALFDTSFYGIATAGQLQLLSKSDLTSDIRQFLRTYHVETIIVFALGKHPAIVVSHMTAAVGPPVRTAGVIVWFHVQRRLANLPR